MFPAEMLAAVKNQSFSKGKKMDNIVMQDANPATSQEIWAILRENTRGMAEFKEGMTEFRESLTEIREGMTEFRVGMTEFRESLTEVREGMTEFRESLAEVREMQKETDRRMEETDRRMEETSRKMEENARQQKETARQMEETDRRMKETERLMEENARQQRETARQMEETDRRMEETERLMEENARQQKETDRRMKETDRRMKETDRRMERTDKKIEKLTEDIGGLRNSIGYLVESFFNARMWELLKDYPYGFKRSYRRVKIYDNDDKDLGDIDILLSNSEWVMVIEVKSFAMEKDLKKHLDQLELIRRYPPAEVKGKKIISGFAAVSYDNDLCQDIHAAGLFVFTINNDLGKLLPPPEGFKAAVWDSRDNKEDK